MPAIFWTQCLIAAQWYNFRDNHLHQDINSSIILENCGKASISKREKHINIPYFFITNRFNNSEVSVVQWPIGDMIDNYITKPLQGAMFSKFRDQIMVVIPAADTGQLKVKVEHFRKA